MPTWLWVFLASATGELNYYMADTKYEIHGRSKTPWEFFRDYKKIALTVWLPKVRAGDMYADR